MALQGRMGHGRQARGGGKRKWAISRGVRTSVRRMRRVRHVHAGHRMRSAERDLAGCQVDTGRTQDELRMAVDCGDHEAHGNNGLQCHGQQRQRGKPASRQH